MSLQSTVLGQGFADSLYFFRQDLKRTEFAYSGLAHLVGSNIDKTSRLGLIYTRESGHFRRAQQAESQSDAQLYTDGIRSLGKFKFAGHFKMDRVWQDSLAWSTKLNEDDMTPYYYGSIKAGKFEKLGYDLGGLASYQISDKVFAGSGVSYSYQSSARSVDPRASIDVFSLEISPALLFKFKDNFFGINGVLGYATENTSITFKSRDYMLSLGYPDRINYYLRGYGFLDRTRHGVQSDVKTSTTKGVGINHSYRNGQSSLSSGISYKYRLERNGKELTNSSRDTIRSEFVVNTINMNLLYSFSENQNHHQLDLSAGIVDAYDRDLILQGSNYSYTRKSLTAGYLLRSAGNESFSPEWGLGIDFEDVNRNDLSSAHTGSYQLLESSLSASFYIRPGHDQFRIGTGFSYSHPLQYALLVPESQETVFTSGVIIPDHDFHKSKAFRARADFSWQSRSLLKQFTTAFLAEALYSSRMDEPGIWNNQTFVSDKGRMVYNIGINLFF